MKNIMGHWTTNDIDTNYNLLNEVTFYQDINHWFNHNDTVCKTVDLLIEIDSFKYSRVYKCREPGRGSYMNNQSISIKGLPLFRRIIINNGIEVIVFKVIKIKKERIDRYPYKIKQLKLKRID